MEVQKRLNHEKNIVISEDLFGYSDDDEGWENVDEKTLTTKAVLDDMHMRRIRNKTGCQYIFCHFGYS